MTEGEKNIVSALKRVEDLLSMLVRLELLQRLSPVLRTEKESAIYRLTGTKTQPVELPRLCSGRHSRGYAEIGTMRSPASGGVPSGFSKGVAATEALPVTPQTPAVV